ncbi:hypothetical protein [Paenibacillus sp. WLX2291]|uniref:hypothetical protein n=1 Tax=Paenibacillus sp. WLX2291 TaxID=3296934 RepID=UPI003984559C
MSNIKEEVRKKWLFMNKEEMIPGLIVDNMTYEQMIGWMDTTPYEDARKRMNSEEVESFIIEFVEMMWSIIPDYYDLKAILDTEFYIKNEDCGMLVECTVNTNTVKLLKKISMLLSQSNRHIQVLTLYVSQQ